nr:cytochrome C oxidase subunit IV family protein [Coralloluteibacterium stylophorae]
MRTEYLLTAALLVLLGLNVASAWLPLGRWRLAVNLAIAATQAGLVMAVAMHLRSSRPLLRYLVAAAGVLVALLIGMVLADSLTRQAVPAPW